MHGSEISFITVHFHIHFQLTISIIIDEIALHVKIAKINFRSGVQVNVALNTGDTPHVLALQITAIAPAINLKRHEVFTGFHIFGNIKFCRQFAVFAIANFLPVHPNKKS